MKKIVLLLMVIVLVLAGCGNSETTDTTEAGGVEATQEEATQEEISDNAENKEAPAGKEEMPEASGEPVDLPEDLSDELKELIWAMPTDMQERIVSEIPDEITAEYEEMLLEKLSSFGDGSRQAGEKGERGEKGEGEDHHHAGLSDEIFNSSTRIELDGATTYTDGTYIGTADGYAEDLSVEIVIENNGITEISIISHNETPGFYEEAFKEIPELIMSNQSTQVDTVSGATATSQGIILAVEEALNKAVE